MHSLKKVLLYIMLLISIVFTSCGKKNMSPNVIDMQEIFNVAVMECYYHNIAETDKNGKKQWIEYSSTIKLGIDASKLDIEVKDNLVTITVPKSKILSWPNVEHDSIKTLTDTSGIIKTKFTNEDQIAAVKFANDNAMKTAENNQQLLNMADIRVKKIIENYINQIGAFTGIDYNIKWIMIQDEES